MSIVTKSKEEPELNRAEPEERRPRAEGHPRPLHQRFEPNHDAEGGEATHEPLPAQHGTTALRTKAKDGSAQK